MKKITIPRTVNLHNLIPCNYRCGFCYAGFPGLTRKQLPQKTLHSIIGQIAESPCAPESSPRKVTFAGGEPLLSKTILEDIAFAKSCGLVTALVTNGSFLTPKKLTHLQIHLDWLTLSIDSLSHTHNLKIGRTYKGQTQSAEDYLQKLRESERLGIRTKVNTVVNRINIEENFSDFMAKALPRRWKILQTTRIKEENGSHFTDWSVNKNDFVSFVERHRNLESLGITLVQEASDAIYGSYAMVSPDGRFFSNVGETYHYSRPIVEVGIEEAFAEVAFSQEHFDQREGNYDFASGKNLPKEAEQ